MRIRTVYDITFVVYECIIGDHTYHTRLVLIAIIELRYLTITGTIHVL